MAEREAAPRKRSKEKGHVHGYAVKAGVWTCIADFYDPKTPGCGMTWRPA